MPEDPLLGIKTISELSLGAQRLESLDKGQLGSSVNLSEPAALKAAEGRVTLLYAAVLKGGPIREMGSVSFPSKHFMVLLCSAWVYGLYAALMIDPSPLKELRGFVHLAEAQRAIDAVAEERGPEAASQQLGMDLMSVFSFCKTHSAELLAGSEDKRLEIVAPSVMMDGIMCALTLRRLDANMTGKDIPTSEL